jgi:predicted kinase
MGIIHCLIGISSSGKSTYAHELLKNIEGVIINRDKLREMTFGYTEKNVYLYYDDSNLYKKEKIINELQNNIIRQSLYAGIDVIVDNTNLKESYINQLKSFNVPIKFHVIKCDLDEAIKRDNMRDRQVGAEVIIQQYNKFKNLLKNFDFSDWFPESYQSKIQQDTSLPKGVIFDIDGTLAKSVDRGPFEWDKVFNDELRLAVYEAYLAHKKLNNKIIICSGRDGCCEQETKKWLDFYGIEYDDFYIRKPNDSRKDYIVKEEMWKEIVKKYYVVCMYDDRDQVVHHGRKLGFDVFQVNYGNF